MGLSRSSFKKTIQVRQIEKEKMVFNELKQQYPDLAEYEKLTQTLGQVKGYKAEQTEALLQKNVRNIVGNEGLHKLLQEKLPSFVCNLAERCNSK
ncbi:hypothetical protein [Legionella rubrilucens]|uniref:hypothetical protein n=1 Tax=Legionella rubrilucens TaxID=458 RepID=UPI00073084B5|nr:hypothetical protein [Legionella rubrilucens]